MKISRVLIVNTLCCAIGPLLAWNAYWVVRYWPAIVLLWEDTIRWVV